MRSSITAPPLTSRIGLVAQRPPRVCSRRLADTGATAIVTFPAHTSSYGLSGSTTRGLARRWFSVTEKTVSGRFSTLGGNNTLRAPRSDSSELLLLLQRKTLA